MFCGAAENSQLTVSVNDADTRTMHSSFKHKKILLKIASYYGSEPQNTFECLGFLCDI